MTAATVVLALIALAGAVRTAPEPLPALPLDIIQLSGSSGPPAPHVTPASRAPVETAARRSTRATSADSLLSLISDLTRVGGGGGAKDFSSAWGAQPVPMLLPIGGSGQRSVSTPVLVLPVPVPVSVPAECPATTLQQDVPQSNKPGGRWMLKSRQPVNNDPLQAERLQQYSDVVAAAPVPAAPVPAAPVPAAPARVPAAPAPTARRPVTNKRKQETLKVVTAGSPLRLVDLFRSQQRLDPHLPPMVITIKEDKDGTDVRPPVPPFDLQFAPQQSRSSRSIADPPRPRFDRSLMIRGELTVPRAGYTETYVAWWDSKSGSARINYFDGGTSTYRLVEKDGTVRGVLVYVDRTKDVHVMRCEATTPRRVELSDRAPPVLPDPNLFSFAGYVESDRGLMERWQYTMAGAGGELGGVRGEALTFHHELQVMRAPDNATTLPVKYTVSVDSSVLGLDCEGYEHRYTEVQLVEPEPTILQIDIKEVCEELVQIQQWERVEPLREFIAQYRDIKYNALFESFQNKYARAYENDVEGAVRKALLVQNLRFINAGNRMGSTSLLGNNFLGDRLDEEVKYLLGVDGSHVLDALANGTTDETLSKQSSSRLPESFDWREFGAVSDVLYQQGCKSCWAFAVTGAVEGALFIRKGHLTQLSVQQLVDCAQPFGGKGCSPTWPRAAYDYIQQRGLNEYKSFPPYKGFVGKPCLDTAYPPATYISGHVNVTQYSTRALQEAIRRHAPTVVIVDGLYSSFRFHEGGLYADKRCGTTPKPLNHAVLAVGWGQSNGSPYFILKNSWSTTWCEQGYIRVDASGNTCGMLTAPSYPVLQDRDVVSSRA